MGILPGLGAVDMDGKHKYKRERRFPMSALDRGITFSFDEATASYKEDEERIRTEIGSEAGVLQSTVRGVVAGAALQLVLKKGKKNRDQYLRAVREGNVRRLRVDLSGHAVGDTVENVDAILAAFTGDSPGRRCEVLELKSYKLVALPAGPPSVLP